MVNLFVLLYVLAKSLHYSNKYRLTLAEALDDDGIAWHWVQPENNWPDEHINRLWKHIYAYDFFRTTKNIGYLIRNADRLKHHAQVSCLLDNPVYVRSIELASLYRIPIDYS